MRRFTKWLLVLGAIALPYPAHAQYYYYPTPAYYYNQQRPVYYGQQYPYGYQGGAASYYPQYYQQSQPVYSYPSTSYSNPGNSYGYPSSSYYATTAQPMPSAPNYYPSAAPVAPPLPKTHDLPVNIGAPPVINDSTGDSESIKPSQPHYVYPNTKSPPEMINIQPPASVGAPPVPTLPAACASCKAGTVDEAHPDGAACTNCQKPAKTCHIEGFADALYWNVRGSNLPFAQAFDGIDPLSVPRGSVGMALPGYALGVHAGFGVALDDHSWLTFGGIYYDNTTHSQLAATDGNVLHSLLVFPATVNSAPDSLIAHADYATRLETFEVDYKFAFWNTDRLELSFIGGGRYAHLQQLLSTDFQILGTTTVDGRITFDGAGVRTGLEGEYRIKGGFYGYGKGLVDLLGGHFAANYTQQNVFAGLQAQTQFGEDRIVPILELELGAGWVSPKGHIRASAGYYVGAWFNTLTMPSLVQGIQNTNFTTNGDNFRDTLTFDGFVGKIEFRF